MDVCSITHIMAHLTGPKASLTLFIQWAYSRHFFSLTQVMAELERSHIGYHEEK